MEFFDPQLGLYKRTYIQENKSLYYLHIVVFTDNARLEAGIVRTDLSRLETEKIVQVDLTISENVEKPLLDTVNPICYTIELGELDYSEDVVFEINQDIDATSGEYSRDRPKKKSTRTSVTFITRPAKPVTVEAAWKEIFGTELTIK